VAGVGGKPGRWGNPLAMREWLRGYDRGMFRADLAAGGTLAAYLLPAALGDSSLAGLPPQAGLYACLFGGLVFWLFCSSRQTAVTVTSAISLLIGTSLGELAGGDTVRFAAMASCTALLMAALAFAAWLLRAGSIVSFLSETVLIGFKAGVALCLASTQLPKLLGIKSGHGGFWEHMEGLFRHLGEVNRMSLLLGGGALVLLALGKKIFPHKPVTLFVVVGGIILASAIDFSGHGVKLLGTLPAGLPAPSLPAVNNEDLRELLPLAFACFLLGAVETAAIGRMFAEKHGRRFDCNQEFFALGGANLAAGLGHGFPVSGGMSQSLVNESSGARTPLSGLVAAVLILIVTLFFSDLLSNLPQPVLAAVVLMAVSHLVDFKALARLWKVHRAEFSIAMVSLLGVLWAGLLQGVLVGAIISLVMLIRRVSAPHVAFLGRIPGLDRYSDIQRHPSNQPIPGVLAFRVEAGIVYFNAEYVFDVVMNRVLALEERPRLVVCDLSTSPYLDRAGARMFSNLHDELAKQGITFRLVEAHAEVRDMLRVEGAEDKMGRIDRSVSLGQVIRDLAGG